MALEIQFVDKAKGQLVQRFQLRSVEDSWLLPDVILAPINRLPHISRVHTAVAGKPAGVASRLQAVFFNKEFKPPFPLGARRAIGGGRLADAGPLPADVVCELTVTVAYFDSDGKGQPSGGEQLLTRSCKLFSSPLPDQPPELEVDNREGLIVTVDEPARLVIRVRHPRDERPPRVALLHPESVLAADDPQAAPLSPALHDVRKNLESALTVTFQRIESDGLLTTFHLNFTLKLAQATKSVLQGLAEPLVIPLVATLDGARPASLLIRLETKQQQFPGWLVIDFGTTNSAVSMFDPRSIPPIEGLHPEQEEALRGRLASWLSRPAEEAFANGRRFDADWRRLLNQVGASLDTGPDNIAAGVMGVPPARLYDVLAQLELAVRGMREEFRRAVAVRLHACYHEALREPALRLKNIYPVHLDQTRNYTEIPSELMIRELGEVLGVEMGEEVQKARLQAIGAANGGDMGQVLNRFHPSPKRYFGTDQPPFRVTIDEKTQDVEIRQLMQAGWRQLIHLTERVRSHDPQRFSAGPFRRAVITYPTVAPPAVRQSIRGLIERLNVSDVRTDYDEAVAAAIFYMVREYGGAAEIGLESFRARSRIRSLASSVQNVLVFDVGGGTTDVALIRLQLTEEEAFAPGEDRGAGGRYYKITPKILCSTGHMQLGGELMTLRVFRLLKALLADHLLTLTQEGRLRCEYLKGVLAAGVDRKFADDKGKFRPGSILRTLDQDNPERDEIIYNQALALAERVSPTRWAESDDETRPARLQAFYTLWGIADRAKIALGGRTAAGNPPAPLALKPEELRELLDQCLPEQGYQFADSTPDARVRLAADQVDRAVGPVVREAVSIARGALSKLPAGEKLDWLILSGQSCHLTLVERALRAAFQEPDKEPEAVKFVWNPERVTFVPRYAKLATSLGACFAEYFRRYKYAPRESRHLLRRGVNMLHFDIDNLFSYLPCAFKLIAGPSTDALFRALEELYEVEIAPDGDHRGKARTPWQGRALKSTVLREDYEGGPQTLWGDFDAQELANELGFGASWQEQIKIQFEIDHRLNVDVLLCRFADAESLPHHRLTEREPRLDLAAALNQLQRATPSPAAAGKGRNISAGSSPSPTAPPPLFDPQRALDWMVAVGDPVSRSPVKLFDRKQALSCRFHLPEPDGRVKSGLLSTQLIESFPENDRLEVYVCPPGGTAWQRLGEIERPADRPEFRCRYQFSLDEDGILRIHPGLAPYWESNDRRVLREQPGRVFRTELARKPREAEHERNPFTGKH